MELTVKRYDDIKAEVIVPGPPPTKKSFYCYLLIFIYEPKGQETVMKLRGILGNAYHCSAPKRVIFKCIPRKLTYCKRVKQRLISADATQRR